MTLPPLPSDSPTTTAAPVPSRQEQLAPASPEPGQDMLAAAVDSPGPAESLRVMRIPCPTPGPGEVLVRVRFSGIQPADVAARGGWTPPGVELTFPLVPGHEFSGVVAARGPGTTRFRIGDDVLGFRVLGCHAEFVSVPVTQLVPLPQGLDPVQAGALSASGQTAHTALEDLGVTGGDTVLIHGAAGGVGSMAVQLAVEAGARVIGTASEENLPHLRALGAEAVRYGPGQLDALTTLAPSGVDVVLDVAGQGDLRSASALARDSQRVATIADMALADELGLRIIRSRRSADRLRMLADRAARGLLKVPVREVMPLTRAAEAHRQVETGHGRGKIVLQISSPASGTLG